MHSRAHGRVVRSPSLCYQYRWSPLDVMIRVPHVDDLRLSGPNPSRDGWLIFGAVVREDEPLSFLLRPVVLHVDLTIIVILKLYHLTPTA